MLVVGAGFLGTALARQLVAGGHRVHLLSRRAQIPQTTGIQYHRGSLDDHNLVRDLLRSCQTIYHTASTTTPGSSARDPVIEGTDNILPTLKWLHNLQANPDVHLVYLSSGGCLYGNLDRKPINEQQCPQPVSYHGAGKLAIETFLRAYVASQPESASVTILRPSNLYGIGQSLRTGFGLVRTVLDRLHSNQPIEIWGDGEMVRDYLYIDDLVDACLAVDRQSGGSRYRVYNVGTGTGCSVNQLVALAERVSGCKADMYRQPSRSVDVQHVILDSTALRQDTGWSPVISLEDGLRRTWQWLFDLNRK
jgi:UDP-glucose 4-epimerase